MNTTIETSNSRRRHRARWSTALLVAVLGIVLGGDTVLAEEPMQDYTELDLEALINLEIVSVSKRPESMNDASAAVFVVTPEMIRRSGATSVPEVLRMVPGMQVAQIDANKWAVTARGFNSFLANKLLVLVDGRSAYEPIFSGVFWESIGVALADVERIEVIRGPGATMWGANAMNGVINIITKRTSDTRGVRLAAAAGTELRALGSARLGGVTDNVGYRATAEYIKRDDSLDEFGEDAGDGWDLMRVTARVDSDLSSRDQLTLTGHYYDSAPPSSYLKPQLTPPYADVIESTYQLETWAALARWSHEFNDRANIEVQAFYNGRTLNDSLAIVDEEIADVEVKHAQRLGEAHSLVAGVGYRTIRDETRPGLVTFEPPSRDYNLWNVFCQDTWDVAPDRWRLTFGAKYEMFDGKSGELQPNLRLAWTPTATQTVWGAASRAVRTPSRYEESVRFTSSVVPPGTPDNPSPVPAARLVTGSDGLGVENLIAYELGYRIMPAEQVSCDLALFYHDYDDLRSITLGAPSMNMVPIPHAVVPLNLDSQIAGQTWGAELATDWRVKNGWDLRAAFTYFDDDLELLSGNEVASINFLSTMSSSYRMSVTSSADLTRQLEFDLWLWYASRIDELEIGEVWSLDTRLGWRVGDNVELSVVGQHLLDAETIEFRDSFLSFRPAWIQRGVYGQVTLWF